MKYVRVIFKDGLVRLFDANFVPYDFGDVAKMERIEKWDLNKYHMTLEKKFEYKVKGYESLSLISKIIENDRVLYKVAKTKKLKKLLIKI